eukprot:PhF_6_TR28119/c0_g1_i1/m.41599
MSLQISEPVVIFQFNVTNDSVKIPNCDTSSCTIVLGDDETHAGTKYFHIIRPTIVNQLRFRILADGVAMGSGVVVASESNDKKHLVVPIFGDKYDVIGTLSYSVLICTPFVHQNNTVVGKPIDFATPAHGGHRGNGAVSLSVNRPSRFKGRTKPRENTIASFLSAAERGFEMVEFDVQLTRNGLPVVFHDFELKTCAEDRTVKGREIVPTPLALLSYRQLNQVLALENRMLTFKGLVLKHWKRIVGRGYVPPEIHVATITDDIPTYEDLFKQVPENVCFDVEVKYPAFDQEMHISYIGHNKNLNNFVDAILKVTFDNVGSRKILFSCFNAEACLLLKLKQSKYDVMFLTDAPRLDVDGRGRTLQNGLDFSVATQLRGIICNSRSLKTDQGCLPKAKALGKEVWTYGSLNNDTEWAGWQRSAGVGTVISDTPPKFVEGRDYGEMPAGSPSVWCNKFQKH